MALKTSRIELKAKDLWELYNLTPYENSRPYFTKRQFKGRVDSL